MPTAEEPEVNGFFDTVSDQIGERVNRLTEDKNNRIFYTALLIGGSTMAKCVVKECEGVKKAWAGGDEAKALALTRLFTLLMLSQCYQWLDARRAEQQEPTGPSLSAVSNISQLFGDDSEEAIKDFLAIDTQFRYDLKYRSHMVHLGIVLLAKACEVCGYNCLDWSKVSFPVKSMEPLARSRAIIDSAVINSVDDIKTLWNCHALGVQAMTRYYEEQALAQ